MCIYEWSLKALSSLQFNSRLLNLTLSFRRTIKIFYRITLIRYIDPNERTNELWHFISFRSCSHILWDNSYFGSRLKKKRKKETKTRVIFPRNTFDSMERRNGSRWKANEKKNFSLNVSEICRHLSRHQYIYIYIYIYTCTFTAVHYCLSISKAWLSPHDSIPTLNYVTSVLYLILDLTLEEKDFTIEHGWIYPLSVIRYSIELLRMAK